MTPFSVAITSMVIAAVAEALHCARILKAQRLLLGRPDALRATALRWVVLWTALVRVLAIAALCWGLSVLWTVSPLAIAIDPMGLALNDAEKRHIIILLDVSPSMALRDAGEKGVARSTRAAEVVLDMLAHVNMGRTRLSVVVFYSTSKPVVIDTYDPNVVYNVVNGLPLTSAFRDGKTDVIAGLNGAFELASRWSAGDRRNNTSLLIVTDGDSVPPTGMPKPPPSIDRVVIAGIGDEQRGEFIDGHMSRQESRTLRAVATGLRADYFNANKAHLPADLFATFADAVPATNASTLMGRREAALLACVLASGMLLLLPVGLAGVDYLQSHGRNGGGSSCGVA